MLNFKSGGKMGDFIHSIYAVKNLCQEQRTKANLYVAHGGDVWTYGLEKAYNDLVDVMQFQPYINLFGILPQDFNDPIIDLNTWRVGLERNYETRSYAKCWSDVLSKVYNFKVPPSEYKWISAHRQDDNTAGKILIHRSDRHHNAEFPWARILSNININEDVLFLTSTANRSEWDSFRFKSNRIYPYFVDTVSDMISAIGSCRTFIGNQSSPFAMACALDVPRIVELDRDPAGFYMYETQYTNNMSWFLDNGCKHESSNVSIRI